MSEHSRLRWLAFALSAAAIGRAMAQSGDWLTPRLWGDPWFEKPALLYWMTATGFKLGWNQDLAPRLPVALLSVAFLAFFWILLRREFGERVAWYATAILTTSAGWLAYSHIAVTDLPLAACFSAAMLLVMAERSGFAYPAAGVFLGLAILAKGLVPLVLFLPALWFWRRRPAQLALLLAIALLVAAPWYALVTWRNGMPFIDDFFVKQHFARFTTGALQHVRPFWFFGPILLGAIFPWTPLLATLFRRSLYSGRREQFLLAWLLFGLVFFSISRNKLPGYLLPLLPALAALLGIALAQARNARWILAIAGAIIWLIPSVAQLLPQALAAGLSRASFHFNYLYLVPMLATAWLFWWLERQRRRDAIVATIVVLMTLFVVNIAWEVFPVLDRTVSARAYWQAKSDQAGRCTDTGSDNRSWRYGLNYYAQKIVPDCNPRP